MNASEALDDQVSQAAIKHFRNFEALEVPNWRRVAGYTDPTLSSDLILAELGVEYFLSGEVSMLGDSIHLRWDLEDGRSVGEQIEIAVASGAGTTSLGVLTDIIRQITHGLRRELGRTVVGPGSIAEKYAAVSVFVVGDLAKGFCAYHKHIFISFRPKVLNLHI